MGEYTLWVLKVIGISVGMTVVTLLNLVLGGHAVIQYPSFPPKPDRRRRPPHYDPSSTPKAKSRTEISADLEKLRKKSDRAGGRK